MSDSGSNTGIVAVLAIFVMVVVVGFFAMKSGVIGGGGGGGTKEIDIKIDTPVKNAD